MNIDFYINNKIELNAFEDQVTKLKGKLDGSEHLENMLFIAGKIVELERNTIEEIQFLYRDALADFEKVEKILKYHSNENLTSIEIIFNEKNSIEDRISIVNQHTKPFLKEMFTYYLDYLLEQNRFLLIEIFQKEISKTEFSRNHLLKTISFLRNGLIKNTTKILKTSIMINLHHYMKDYSVFIDENGEMSSNQARVIYFIFCILNIEPILTKRTINGKASYQTKKLKSYNDQIINKIKKAFKDIETVNKTAIVSYDISNNKAILELLKNELS